MAEARREGRMPKQSTHDANDAEGTGLVCSVVRAVVRHAAAHTSARDGRRVRCRGCLVSCHVRGVLCRVGVESRRKAKKWQEHSVVCTHSSWYFGQHVSSPFGFLLCPKHPLPMTHPTLHFPFHLRTFSSERTLHHHTPTPPLSFPTEPSYCRAPNTGQHSSMEVSA